MQRGRDQRSGNPGAFQRHEVGAVAYAAGGVDAAIAGTFPDLAQPLDVGSRAAPDTCERHDDDAIRPEFRHVEQRRRTDERVAAEIEREDDARIVLQAGDQRGVALRLAAENEVTLVKPGAGRAGFGEAVVDPERKRRETRP